MDTAPISTIQRIYYNVKGSIEVPFEGTVNLNDSLPVLVLCHASYASSNAIFTFSIIFFLNIFRKSLNSAFLSGNFLIFV